MSLKKKRGPDVGAQAESAVIEIIQRLIAEQKTLKYRTTVADYVHARKSCQYDQSGIDILIIFNTGLSLPLQVKKSLTRGHRKHLIKHPSIIWVFGVGSLPKNSEDFSSYERIRRNLEILINEALTQHAGNGNGNGNGSVH